MMSNLKLDSQSATLPWRTLTAQLLNIIKEIPQQDVLYVC